MLWRDNIDFPLLLWLTNANVDIAFLKEILTRWLEKILAKSFYSSILLFFFDLPLLVNVFEFLISGLIEIIRLEPGQQGSLIGD